MRQHPGIDERDAFLRTPALHLDRETTMRVYRWDPESARVAQASACRGELQFAVRGLVNDPGQTLKGLVEALDQSA
ncbi:MAG: hypothetical protein ABSH32_33510, partial [Bryobacteraceae bacterium]